MRQKICLEPNGKLNLCSPEILVHDGKESVFMQLIGKTLGQYRITEQIGEGGMATVYKAYQPSLDRYVAIKVLSSHHAKTAEFKDRFFREAKSIAKLNHPNILPIYDVGMAEDMSFIVMKFISGQTMNHIMGQKMDLLKICRFMDQIAGALDHAHDSGIIHRDIKPANLLLDGDWVFLTDFGIAKIMEASIALTSTGEVMGTPAYMSPEQALGKTVDHRTDIYSLGIVLYQMVTGEVPFKGETPYGVVFRHIYDALPLPRGHRHDLPENVERVILKALAKEPNDRYDRTGKLAEALRDAVERPSKDPIREASTVLGDQGRGPQPVFETPDEPLPPSVTKSPVSNRKSILIAAVLLSAIVGSLIVFLSHTREHGASDPSQRTARFEPKEAPQSQKQQGVRYYVRIYNIDDIGYAYVNEKLIKETEYKGDSGWIDITNNLIKGQNTVRFVDINYFSGWTYGFMLKKDDKVIWHDECGEAGSVGCRDNTKGIVFDKRITIDF